MSRPKPAQRAAAANVAASLAALLSPARAEASRRNGARSKGPKTPEGKERSSRNALKHGLCAGHHVVVEGESPEAFVAFEAALVDDLAPAGALQTLLAGRIARAAWRLERAERIEAELFARQMDGPFGDGDLGLALVRDGNGARAFETLLRYRGAAQAELTRTLRTLKALQAEAATIVRPGEDAAQHAPGQERNEPETRTNAGASGTRPAAAGDTGDRTRASATPAGAQHKPRDHRGPSLTPPAPASALPRACNPHQPNEPELRSNPGGSAEKQPQGDGAASPAVPPSLRPAVGARTPRVA
jgi:hypothetical protein